MLQMNEMIMFQVQALQYERPVKYSGEWLNEYLMVDSDCGSTRLYMVTKCTVRCCTYTTSRV